MDPAEQAQAIAQQVAANNRSGTGPSLTKIAEDWIAWSLIGWGAGKFVEHKMDQHAQRNAQQNLSTAEQEQYQQWKREYLQWKKSKGVKNGPYDHLLKAW